ncbi:CLUMA_CG009199, isoform A [Clunio marinus]|uniref:Large ribosomal subunit protein eL14 n=1 Tax=Clunio marinus TaxID=568069 RepID=A0A1J1I9U8_9DIPT|nr:CLUMA_CG009199, isoform A [Clunio marinus]
MGFTRFVQTGRVARISRGRYKGKLVAIVDIIDQNRVLIDGPLTRVPRQQYPVSHLHLTKFVVKFPFTAPTRVVKKALEDFKLKEKWSGTLWAERARAKRMRSNLTDFERFKLRLVKRSKNRIIEPVFDKLKKTASKSGLLFGKPIKGTKPLPAKKPKAEGAKKKKKVNISPKNKVFNVKLRFYTKLSSSKGLKSLDMMPGPRGFIGLGNIFNYSELFGKYSFTKIHESGMDKYQKYGSIVCERMIPGVNIVWLYDPNDIEKIYQEEVGDYPRRESHSALAKYRIDHPHIYKNAGLLSTNGEEWWRIRSQFQKGLSSPKNVRNFLPTADVTVKEFINHMPKCFDKDSIINDFSIPILKLKTQLMTLLIFGEELEPLSDINLTSNSECLKLAENSGIINSLILPTDQGFRLWKFFNTSDYKKLVKALKHVENVALKLLAKKKKDSNGKSLFDYYMANSNVDMKDVNGIALDLVHSGIHTGSYTTLFALNYISRDERIQNKLREEIFKALPNADDPVTASILDSGVPYTKAVLKETLRLNPISVGVGRILNKDKILSGYLVPKNTNVVTQNMIICRLEKYFENPLEFIPERWTDREKRKEIHPFIVLPFGHGMRGCIARRLAEQNILLFLIRLFRCYEVQWQGKPERLDCITNLINEPNSIMSLHFKKLN